MGQTTILDETIDDFTINEDGVITNESHRTRQRIKKSKVDPTDEFVKVSKYLNVIFAYNNIPLNLVPISLLIAQRMEFKTNFIYLFKADKEEFAQMLDISVVRVNALLQDCKKYDILRPTNTRGKYVVNGYLFSTGSIIETRKLQAQFDFDNGFYVTSANHKNTITGETVRKIVTNYKDNKQIQGQLSFNDLGEIYED